MASSLQTLAKILRLEKQKGYQNTAVIGGFARFAYHWAREAHGQATTDAHHELIDEITRWLREYEDLSEQQRPAALDKIIALATGQAPIDRDIQTAPTEVPERSQDDIGELFQEESVTEDQTPVSDVPAQTKASVVGPEAVVEEHRPVPERTLPVRERRGYARLQLYPATPEELRQLDASVTTLHGVAEKRAQQLEQLGVYTLWDLLFLFPRRYDDYSRMKLISQLKPGEEVTVVGFPERVESHRMQSGGTRVEAYLGDGSGYLRLNWFNQPWMKRRLRENIPVVASGKVDQYLGRLVMNSAELEPVDRESLNTGRIVPVYPLTKGLNGRTMRRLTKDVVDNWALRLPDHLPLSVRERADLMDYGDAVSQAHFPDSMEDKEAALYRLAFDELFVMHLAMLQKRHTWQSRQGTPLAAEDDWVLAFEESLPYHLTSAQQCAIADLRHDMASDVPMNRLLQGDVGSGKTVVAALAVGITLLNGVQAAIMAPTSILAEQHFVNFNQILSNSPLGDAPRIALLTGKLSQSERETIYAELASGQVQVVVGTHALIQPGVEFAHLGLAIIDEQHRFGVEQRGALREKAAGGNPHLLVMTATPIPRTLALTLHADLDLTIIDEMPPGREPVQTRVLQPKERQRAYAFIKGQIDEGRQAFIICPLVEESDRLDARAAVAEHERLQNEVFPELRLGLLHGRMQPEEKEAVMEAFYQGEMDVLVSTTVLEVGIDVPNASVMMVENATRFGLAQLHQLRGRVGRGEHKSYCLLVSDTAFFDSDERLRAMEETSDGFRLAQIDWELRGAGDLLGTRQSGLAPVRFADLMDSRLVEQVQREARAIHEQDPELIQTEHRLLAQLVNRFSHEGDIS